MYICTAPAALTYIAALQTLHLMPGWPVGLWTSDQPDTFGRLMQVMCRPGMSQPASILLLELLSLQRQHLLLQVKLLPGGLAAVVIGGQSRWMSLSWDWQCKHAQEGQQLQVQCSCRTTMHLLSSKIRACATLPSQADQSARQQSWVCAILPSCSHAAPQLSDS